jgi:hypothetical protein
MGTRPKSTGCYIQLQTRFQILTVPFPIAPATFSAFGEKRAPVSGRSEPAETTQQTFLCAISQICNSPSPPPLIQYPRQTASFLPSDETSSDITYIRESTVGRTSWESSSVRFQDTQPIGEFEAAMLVPGHTADDCLSDLLSPAASPWPPPTPAHRGECSP